MIITRQRLPLVKGKNVKRNSFVLVLYRPSHVCIYNLYDPVLYPGEKCAEGYRAVDEK